MFKLPPGDGDLADASDAADKDLGWTCFGNMGFGGIGGERVDNAQWLGAWAPGGARQSPRRASTSAWRRAPAS